jgi:hypothetical protein
MRILQLWGRTQHISPKHRYHIEGRRIRISLKILHNLKTTGYSMYHLIYDNKTRHSAHTVYLCVPYGSHSKQRLFPQTALTCWSVAETWCASCEVRNAHTVYLCVPYGSHSKQRLFPQTALTCWSVTETWCASCEVRTAHTVYLCVPYGSDSKQRLCPYTARIAQSV